MSFYTSQDCVYLSIDTLVVQSFTVQSKEEVTNRCEKSTGPTAAWQWIPVMGPWWPSNISLIPALLFKMHTKKKKLL